jgi:hypothetical protein
MAVDVKAQLEQEIEQRGFDDFYIDSNEEREILQIAIHLGKPMAEGRAILLTIAKHKGYILESELIRTLREGVPTVLRGKKKLNERAFKELTQLGLSYANGKATERVVERLILTILDEVGSVPVSRGLFRDWFSRVIQAHRQPVPVPQSVAPSTKPDPN